MIDCHVHCRDWDEDYKETIAHALAVAENSKISGIFDMPNTNPPVISRDTVRLRLREANKLYSRVFYGLYVGLTPNLDQIKESVECVRDYFPKKGDRAGVIGLKMFAGKSVGNLGIINEEEQRGVFDSLSDLGYNGILVVHCEKESEMHSELWDYKNPITHSYTRPERSEIESIRNIVDFAIDSEYLGKLHIAHVSTSESVELVKQYKRLLNISCGATPHHLLLDNSLMQNGDGILYKVNPPLRDPETRQGLFKCFLNGDIDVLESDHAPHTLSDKTKKHMSGIPWLACWPEVFEILKQKGADSSLIEKMSHDNINTIFGTDINKIEFKGKIIEGDYRDSYAFNPLKYLRS